MRIPRFSSVLDHVGLEAMSALGPSRRIQTTMVVEALVGGIGHRERVVSVVVSEETLSAEAGSRMKINSSSEPDCTMARVTSRVKRP